MQHVLVSIMMPTFNAMPLLRASVESLLRQTLQDWECIIVNDGSTDGTANYLNNIQDRRFRIFHFEKNCGRPIARQKCLDEAKGKYLAMLDAGDLYHPRKLELQVKEMEANPHLSLVCTEMCSFGTRTDLLRKRGASHYCVARYDGAIIPIHAASMLLTNRAQQFNYNPMMKLGQDTDFLSRYLVDQEYSRLPFIGYYYSEFDSVSKKKIIRTYKSYIKLRWKRKEYVNLCKSVIKYCFASIVFPFCPILTILSSRGQPLTETEVKEYEIYCKHLVDNCSV